MNNLQKRLTSISMPTGNILGPLSPQSTLHAISSATSKLILPTTIEVINPMESVAIGVNEVHIGDEVGPIVVHQVQAQSILTGNDTPQCVIMPEENKNQQTMVVQPLPGHSIMVQSRFIQNHDQSVQEFDNNLSIHKDDVKERKVSRAQSIDLHSLEKKLSSIHSNTYKKYSTNTVNPYSSTDQHGAQSLETDVPCDNYQTTSQSNDETMDLKDFSGLSADKSIPANKIETLGIPLHVSSFDIQNVLQRQYFELEILRKRHIEELKNCIRMLKSDGLQPTILYEALSPLSNSSKLLTTETSENSRSTSPTSDNRVTKFTPTGLYFLPESVKLLSPLAESKHSGTNH
jgi:hypothetical protein